ncbi:MAG: DUF2301 domain-containing membrane protein [Nitrospiraceae bacterium]|nr:DUF2301 domain-containing membrane protein [Nitrospiraceae bacterium]
MGDYVLYQPLTRADRITVLLYRAGVALAAVTLSALAAFLALHGPLDARTSSLYFDFFLAALYFSVGLSVFFIHLYIGIFKEYLKRLYYLALVTLALVVMKGNGDAASYVSGAHLALLFLLPAAGCMAFICAKEAFCFRLVEGYLLAIIMPLYLIALGAGALGEGAAAPGLVLIAALFDLFAFRKVLMPIHVDIGDKSAYR